MRISGTRNSNFINYSLMDSLCLFCFFFVNFILFSLIQEKKIQYKKIDTTIQFLHTYNHTYMSFEKKYIKKNKFF